MAIPVIFLAFANDEDQHLPLLEEERRRVSGHLLPLASKNYFQLYTEPSARIQDITRNIIQFKDRIHIFHYGGHAESEQLLLADQEANADGVAQLLARQSNLKLVFLNGCSTKAQVKLLLDLGIPAVIATSVPVEDPAAKAFADVFYDALASDHTIEESFKLAAANHRTRKNILPEIHRGQGRAAALPAEEDLPWGLYVKDDTSDVLEWKLPTREVSSFIVRGAGKSYGRDRTINEMLIQSIANTIESYSPKVQMVVAGARRRRPSLRDLRAAVIDSFPTPMGTHLRKLLLSEEISTDRLQKIINVYNVSVQLLCYVLLSQLWDEKHTKGKIVVPEDQRAVLNAFFNLQEVEYPVYDYAQLIGAIGDIFMANEIEPFLEEFAALRKEFYGNKPFHDAYQFLEEMKKELQGTIKADEIESFCVQAEDHLCEIFTQIGFAAKYTLAAIKTIEIEKQRHEAPHFNHNLVILDRVTASFGILDESFSYDKYSENACVILLRSDEGLYPYLNLSPFVIDENALTGQHNSKIYFLQFFKVNDTQYILTDNLKDTLIVNDKVYPSVNKQLKLFKRAILESHDE